MSIRAQPEHQPQFSIVPQMIGLCAAKALTNDHAGHNAIGDALLSILKPYVAEYPAIAAHWLAALHHQSRLTKPITTANLMQDALRNHSQISAEQGMILSAAILDQTRPGSAMDRIARDAFHEAFNAAMRNDEKALRVPAIALRAAKQVCDSRVDALQSMIRKGVMRVHKTLNN